MKNKGTTLLALLITLSLALITACGSNQDSTTNTPADNQTPNVTSPADNQTSNVTSNTSTSQADTDDSTVPAIVQSDTKVTAQNDNTFPSFSTTDLNGNTVDNTAFANYDMTMINIWGTFCNPCIEEMPDLQTLSGEMPSGTRLIGLVADATDNDKIELAKQIVSENNVTYQNLIPDGNLGNYIDDNVTGVPTTIFVDSSGKIVGDAVVGVRGTDEYLNELNSRLE